MQDMINQIPADVFWTAVVFWFVGAATVWRFARYVERFRDAVSHAKHHWDRAVDFYGHARNNVVGMAAASVVVLGVLFAIGSLAYIRATS